MGMSFERPASADFSIREFALRGEENADGWGLGWYPDRSLAIVKEPVKWRESRYAGFLEDYPDLRSSPLHRARPAQDRGRRADPRRHPSRSRGSWAGREYCFAHNGTLDGFPRPSPWAGSGRWERPTPSTPSATSWMRSPCRGRPPG